MGHYFFMAYLRKRKRSPFWYMRFRDLDSGLWREECTKLRHDDQKQSAQAHREMTKRASSEAKVGPVEQKEDFSAWVPGYIETHYSNPRTKLRSTYFWNQVGGWLESKGLRHTRSLKYEHAAIYLAERTAEGASHNTAREEVKFLGFLMNEAIRREYAERNAIALARIGKAPPKEKKELTDADIQNLRRAYAKKKGVRGSWMATTFELMIHLGCRFSETRIPKDRIDFERMTIQMIDSKRHPDDPRKWFTSPMSKALAEYLKTITWHKGWTIPDFNGPRDRTMMRDFNAVMTETVGATSHSCRVTFISRCHRAGLSESEAMNLVNHSTRMIHRIYSRLNVEDARNALGRVPLLPPRPRGIRAPSAKSSSGRKKGSPAT